MSIIRCLDCGYDLTGLPLKHRCPECGVLYNLKDTTFIPDQRLLLTKLKYLFLFLSIGSFSCAIFDLGGSELAFLDNTVGRFIYLVGGLTLLYLTIKFWKKPHADYYLILSEESIRWKSMVGDVQSYPWPLIRNVSMDKKTLYASDSIKYTVVDIIVLDVAGKDIEIPNFTYEGCIDIDYLYDLVVARRQKALDNIKSYD